MTNWITVEYTTHAGAFVSDYEAFMNQRPMKIDGDSKPLARSKVGPLTLDAYAAIYNRANDAKRLSYNSDLRADAFRICVTVARDVRAEGVTRAQSEMVKVIVETPHFIGAVAHHSADGAERYLFATDLLLSVLEDLGLTNA